MTTTSTRTWIDVLIDQSGPHTLAGIARERRLRKDTPHGATRITMSHIDQSALALLGLAIEHRRNITFAYPVPAGEIAVLLAAQILLHRFLSEDKTPSVGLVTADPAGAARVWDELSITAPTIRARLNEMFPCYRADPDGDSPFGGRKCPRGLLIGSRCNGWRVDMIVEDHLAGPVSGVYAVPTVHIFADPMDSVLIRFAETEDELVWGWSPPEIAEAATDVAGDISYRSNSPCDPHPDALEVVIPRLATVAEGVHSTIEIATNERAEDCIRHIRDDLRTLADLYSSTPPTSLVRGLRVAWHHVRALASLPCRPSDFDRFAGVPPLAARATATFEPEISAWARVLPDEAAEIVSIIASDLGDLRASLEEQPPFLPALAEAALAKKRTPTLAVVGSQTATRGLLFALGGDPDGDSIGTLHIRTMRRLHREGPWPRALVIGLPAPWDWHRVDSGISKDLHILVIGGLEAKRAQSSLLTLHDARLHLASTHVRGRVWSVLVGGELPPAEPKSSESPIITIESARALAEEPDPLEPLAALLHSKPLSLAIDEAAEPLAEQMDDGRWSATVDAVRVLTDRGAITLPQHRSLEVRAGDKIIDCAAEDLRPGMLLLIGRRAGRLGLLEAVADRLRKRRPDLLAAHLLIGDLQSTVRKAFRESGMSKVELFEKLCALGFDKAYGTAIRYVEKEGPLAPRDLADLRRLLKALGIDWSERRIEETFAGVQRQRVFRRAAGRILAQAARGATAVADVGRVDAETGLSLADLRDAVIEAEVRDVVPAGPVPWSETGQLVP